MKKKNLNSSVLKIGLFTESVKHSFVGQYTIKSKVLLVEQILIVAISGDKTL